MTERRYTYLAFFFLLFRPANVFPLFLFVSTQHVKLKYNLYYFQVQNMAETLQGQRPKLMQVGPYAYDEYYVKFDIEFSDHGDTVSYNTQKYYIFNQEETGPGLAEDDQITLPYAVVIGFEFFLQQVPVSASDLLQAAIGVCCCASVASIIALLFFYFFFSYVICYCWGCSGIHRFAYNNISIILHMHTLHLQTQLVEAEDDMESMMDTLYVDIQNTTMPRKVKQALLTQVVATNQSLQVFFEVSCERIL